MSDLLVENTSFVCVTVVDTIGSVPNEVGCKMLVTADGLYFGTVGGGKVEAKAISDAMKLLNNQPLAVGTKAAEDSTTYFVNWALDRDIGMTCGGSVKLYFEAYNTKPWRITLFGAGHCANALADLLIKLDCRITCIDSRQEWLNRMPFSSKLSKLHSSDPPSKVDTIAPGSSIVLLTMGHTTDAPILMRLLKLYPETKFPYIGVIGSDAKAARLKKEIKEAGLPAECENLFHCPMGLPLGNNHPQEIAISIAAQLLQERDKRLGRVGHAQPSAS